MIYNRQKMIYYKHKIVTPNFYYYDVLNYSVH